MSRESESEQRQGAILADRLRDARADLLRQLDGLSPALLRQRPGDDTWSIIEVLAHLADVDYHWLGQAEAIRRDPSHLFLYFDDEQWKRDHPDVRFVPVPEVMHRLEQSHATVVHTLAGLTSAELQRAGRHPRGEPYTVREVFLRYPAHDQNHAAQIRAIRRQLGA
jgi:uncharacterized damage-inducible protein DinB